MAENGEKEDGEKGLHELGRKKEFQAACLRESADTVQELDEEVSEEKYHKLVLEVSELAAKLAEYREKGPGEFGTLVEKSLSAFRQLPVVDSVLPEFSEEEEDKFSELKDQRVSLTQRLEAATGSLPTLLKGFKDCMSRMDNLIAKLSMELRESCEHSARLFWLGPQRLTYFYEKTRVCLDEVLNVF